MSEDSILLNAEHDVLLQEVVEIFKSKAKALFDEEVAKLAPLFIISTIVGWIVYWPFSLMVNLCSDIAIFIEAIVKKMSLGVYNKIYQSLIGDVLNK